MYPKLPQITLKPKVTYPVTRFANYAKENIVPKLFAIEEILSVESLRGKILVLTTEIDELLLNVLKATMKESQTA